MKANRFALILGFVGVLAVVVGIVLTQLRPSGESDNSGFSVGGPFTLTDHTGKTVTEAEYRGKLLLVFFGYTYCPDVCPTQLQVIAQTMEALGGQAEKVQPLFISVDPERDTPAVLKDYVGLFHPRVIGLSGTPEQVAAVAKAYRSYYRRAPGGEGNHYFVDHSAYTYLMGTDGRFLKVFPSSTTAQGMAEEIRKRL